MNDSRTKSAANATVGGGRSKYVNGVELDDWIAEVGWNHERLAESMDVNRSTVDRIVNENKVSRKTFFKLQKSVARRTQEYNQRHPDVPCKIPEGLERSPTAKCNNDEDRNVICVVELLGDVRSFSDSEKTRLLNQIKKVLERSDVVVRQIKDGSVLVEFEVSEREAQIIIHAFAAGELDPNVVDIHVLDDEQDSEPSLFASLRKIVQEQYPSQLEVFDGLYEVRLATLESRGSLDPGNSPGPINAFGPSSDSIPECWQLLLATYALIHGRDWKEDFELSQVKAEWIQRLITSGMETGTAREIASKYFDDILSLIRK